MSKKNRRNSIERRRRRVYLHEHQGDKCFWCHELVPFEASTVDELMPRAHGGSTAWRNIVMACRTCNVRRSDTIAPSWAFEAAASREDARSSYRKDQRFKPPQAAVPPTGIGY